MRNGFVFDLNKCVGCEACVVACEIENHLGQNIAWRAVSVYNEFQHPTLPIFYFSMACNHCEDPRCLDGCPAKAFSIDPIHRTVDHDSDLCIGCRYCMWTCPYDAPKFVTVNGVVEKCTMCKERIAGGRLPNCVNLCPTGALDFSELDDGVINNVAGFTAKDIRPAVRIIPLRRRGRPLAATQVLPTNEESLFMRTHSRNVRKSTLASEWPLVVFTLLAAWLVGACAADLVNGPVLEPISFLALALGGMLVSTLHLGKPFKAWRAVLNVRSSWLSREIVFFSCFIVASIVRVLLPLGLWIHVLGILFGIATLVSIDMVYVTVERKFGGILKSGSVSLSGLLFFAAFSQLHLLLVGLIVAKAVLYFGETIMRKGLKSHRIAISCIRMASGFLTPLILLAMQASAGMLLASIVLGETLNRAEFFLDLDIMTPRKQIERDFAHELASSTLERL